MVFQMDKIVVLVIFNVFLMVTGDSFKEESMERVARNGRARVVFTPIRGKRTYPDTRDSLLRMLEAADALKYYYDQLPYYDSQADDPEAKVTKKVIFTPKLGRSSEDVYEAKRGYDADFTPRLGRHADSVTASDEVNLEDVYKAKGGYEAYFTPKVGKLRRPINGVTASDEVYRQDGAQVDGRSKYFSPRLGRTVELTPRLGRSYNYEIYPNKVRFTRSTNETKST